MPAFSSYNHKNQNVLKDTIIIAVVNSATSIFGGLVVFSVLGHMAHEKGTYYLSPFLVVMCFVCECVCL